VHGHTALFGVNGLLSRALVLIIARLLSGAAPWKESTLAAAFWCMNIGLTLMVTLSLLPIGLAQTVASVNEGLWYARSADFLQQPWLEQLRWLRVLGDTVFLAGVGAFAWFMLGVWAGWSVEPGGNRENAVGPAVPVARTADGVLG
jgi:nitric oxide reductase subunit B